MAHTDTGYKRRLLMLQGAQGQTGFANIEQSGSRVTIQLQAVGLERTASDIHGYLVSLRKRRRLDCGRIRVDSRGQGGLLREYRGAGEMDGVEFGDFDAIAITGGGDVLLVGNLNAGGADWNAIRSVCRLERRQRSGARQFERVDGVDLYAAGESSNRELEPASASAASIIERMQPNAVDPAPAPTPIAIASPTPAPVIESAPARVPEPAAEPVKPSEIKPVSAATPQPLADLISLLASAPTETIIAMTDALKAARKPVVEKILAVERVPVAEPVPVVESVPAAEPIPAREPVAAAKITPAVEPVAAAEIIPAVEPVPAVESIPAAEPSVGATISVDSICHKPAVQPGAAVKRPAIRHLLRSNPTPEPGRDWPVWSAYCKPVWDWPEEASDLREVFERGSPSDDVSLPGWMFVRAPSAISGEESLLGVMVEGDRVTKTAALYRGDDNPEPPAGLAGYTYDGSLGAGYWVRWRDYGRTAARPAI
ncbi:MAG: hypothetical protein LBH66_06975 [Oscillospiraceae bacterium]|nr:hypothetical protein [Oscillospiraceae bacterium]